MCQGGFAVRISVDWEAGWPCLSEPDCASERKRDPTANAGEAVELADKMNAWPGSRSAPLRTPPRTQFSKQHQSNSANSRGPPRNWGQAATAVCGDTSFAG